MQAIALSPSSLIPVIPEADSRSLRTFRPASASVAQKMYIKDPFDIS